VYIFNIKKSSENFSELSNNFFYLKDVKFESLECQKSKDNFLRYHQLCCELVKINKNHFDETGIELENKFEVNF
jgi:hypothetical protein